MKPPNKIYLQIEGTKYDNQDEHASDEVTWCEDKINDSDICYVRCGKRKATNDTPN